MQVRLLGTHHNGHIELTYTKVQSYLFETPRKLEHPMRPSKGHEDWVIDEVRLSESGYVLHEVEFSRGSRWVIESEDFIYSCKPFED